MEESEDIHSEALLNSAKGLDSELSKLKVDQIIAVCEQDPDINKVYGGTVEAIMLWEEETKDRIEDLLKKADIQIQTRKSAVQSGFEKRRYPFFKGDPLSYFAFKK